MKLVKPSISIISELNGENILKEVELAARTCYQSEGKIEYTNHSEMTGTLSVSEYCEATSARILIKKLIGRGHEAMLEFGGMITVRFICDRGVSHELVRHRVASFAQESTRYCNYGKDEHISFIIPSWFDSMEEGIVTSTHIYQNNNGLWDARVEGINQWVASMFRAEGSYNSLLKDHKWSPQQARAVLPNSLKTEINVSANIREWRHIFKLRTAKAAHPQMRELMIPLLYTFKDKIPVLFDDITI